MTPQLGALGTEASASVRACGSCSACCTVMSVREIGKEMYESCTHLCEAGCGIYAERPGSCRTFDCQWLRGAVELDGVDATELRPDACAVIFHYQAESRFGEVFTACEIEPGASNRGHARSIIERLAEESLVMIVSPSRDGAKGPGERSFVGPRHLVTQATALLWSRPAR
ncbi:MAG: hypothetical protein AAF389_10445 [Gemmatimonadota bacterium]